MSPTAQLGDIDLWEHPSGEQKLRELLEADRAFLLAHNPFLSSLIHLLFLECILVSCAPLYTLSPAWASFPLPSLLIHLVLPHYPLSFTCLESFCYPYISQWLKEATFLVQDKPQYCFCPEPFLALFHKGPCTFLPLSLCHIPLLAYFSSETEPWGTFITASLGPSRQQGLAALHSWTNIHRRNEVSYHHSQYK